jgi:hypothetical protein
MAEKPTPLIIRVIRQRRHRAARRDGLLGPSAIRRPRQREIDAASVVPSSNTPSTAMTKGNGPVEL